MCLKKSQQKLKTNSSATKHKTDSVTSKKGLNEKSVEKVRFLRNEWAEIILIKQMSFIFALEYFNYYDRVNNISAWKKFEFQYSSLMDLYS